MRNDSSHSSKNVVLLVTIFVVLFWLLYSLVNALYENQQIQNELDAIVDQNEAIEDRINLKKREAEYLLTPQRVDKEAKIQMGRKKPGERVMVFIEEKLDIIPNTNQRLRPAPVEAIGVPVWKKWWWRFRGN